MKSKAHSKKCQETGVLEELEAEEGTGSTSALPDSLSTSLLPPLPLAQPPSQPPSFLPLFPLLSLPPFHALPSRLLNNREVARAPGATQPVAVQFRIT